MKNQKGFSVVEIVIASSILLLVVVSIFSSYAIALVATQKNTAQLQAAFLAEEGIEAIKNMRDFGYTTYISPYSYSGTSYRLAWTNSHWQATTTKTFIDGLFDRTFVLSSVSRDGSHNIVTSGGTDDPNIKKVTVSVSWNDGNSTTTKTMESYVTNIFAN